MQEAVRHRASGLRAASFRLVVPLASLSLLFGCTDAGEPREASNVGDHVADTARTGGHEGLLVAQEEVPGYLASMTGLLTMKNECVVLNNGAKSYVLVWPAGTEFTEDRRAIIVPQDQGAPARYVLGRTYTLVGGGVSNVDGGSGNFAPPGNPKCKGEAWIVSSTAP